MLKFPLITIVFLLFVLVGKSQIGGTYNYQVLQMVSSSRVAALGGNAAAIRDGDLNLAIYNPALLDSTLDNQIALSYTGFLADAGFGYAGFSKHTKFATFAASLQYLSYGKFLETDVANQVLGEFNAGEYIFGLSAAKGIDSVFSIGATLKYIFSEMAEYRSSAIAVDLGGNYKSLNNLFMASLLLRNIGMPVKHYRPGEAEKLPFEIQMALAYRLENAPFRFHLAGENLQKFDLTPENEKITIDPLTGEPINNDKDGFGENLARHLIAGVEVIITKNLNLRFGYNYGRRAQLKLDDRPGGSGFSYGLGFRISKFHLSYAHSSFNQAEGVNHFTLGIKFSDFKKG